MKNKPDTRHKTTQDVKNNQQRTLTNLRADEELMQRTGDDVIRAELSAANERREQALSDIRDKLKADSNHQQDQLQ